MDRLLLVDGYEITSHNRTFNISETFNSTDIELLTGSKRRFVKSNKKQFSLSFSYLPDKDSITVDQRTGRDRLFSFAEKRGSLSLSIETEPGTGLTPYQVFLESYTEKIVRRDMVGQCIYYDISMEFVEK